jgi:hypothetical protein
MKVNEVLTENTDAYLSAMGQRLSAMEINDAITRGFQDSRIRSKAKEWLDNWNNKISQLKQPDNQTTLTHLLQQLVYSEMETTPSSLSDKAIQQLVDLTSTNQTNTGIALKYMTKLTTLSLLNTGTEKQEISYGDFLPNDMLLPGRIVPVRYVLASDETVWVKFNGDWFKDVDESDHQVKLSDKPAYESAGRLENMRGRNIPMRVGHTGSRTLELLHRSETQDWFKEYE